LKSKYKPRRADTHKFSIVIPIAGTKREAELIPLTLPSFYSVNPSEMIIAIDSPPRCEEARTVLEKTVCECDGKNTRILDVEIGGWADQQVKARRMGFQAAKYERILTADIDLLIVNKNAVLKAVNMVGNGVGLVSCSKFRFPHDFLSFTRLCSSEILRRLSVIRKRMNATAFTGLYAFYRPYLEEVESLERVKKFQKLKEKVRNNQSLALADFFGAGDDTLLRDEMKQKYRVVYLKEIGAFVLTDYWEDRPMVQYGKGIYFAVRGRKTLTALGRAFIRLQPYYFAGHLYGEKLVKRGLVQKKFLWEMK
jgi:hypothetical protein